MIYRRGGAHSLEIAEILKDKPPIAEEEQGRHDILAQPSQHIGGQQRREHGDDKQQKHDGRHEAPHAIHPKMGQIDSMGAIPLLDENAGDQVAGEHEEDGHAQKTARQNRGIKVIQHDCRHGNRAQTVKRRNVTLTSRFPSLSSK